MCTPIFTFCPTALTRELSHEAPALWAILLAGGVGRRLGSDKPKQFLKVGGFPLILWSFHALDEAFSLDGMVVVTTKEHQKDLETLMEERPRRVAHLFFTEGGAQRQDSVRNGLAELPEECESVIVHDGARPFIGSSVAERLVSAFSNHRAVIPGAVEKNTLKRVDKDELVQETLDRKRVYEIQTPQLFHRDLLDNAHSSALEEKYVGTDCASLVERMGEKVKVVLGDEYNLKVTTKRDIFLMKCMIEMASCSPGSGPPVPDEILAGDRG